MLNTIQAANAVIRMHTCIGGATHMRIQKLLFIAHGVSLNSPTQARPLFNEQPLASAYGPIYTSLYRRLRAKGHAPITSPIRHFFVLPPQFPNPTAQSTDMATLRSVTDRFCHFSDTQLSTLCQSFSGAWCQATRLYPISSIVMRQEFEAFQNKLEAA